jgi:hypothetical protein
MVITVDDLVFDETPDAITEEGEPVAESPRRRGRPPGVKNGEGQGRARRSTGENRTVSEALGAMQSAYDLIGLLLLPIAPNASRLFTSGIRTAQESNRRAFEASPKLAKRIATTGEKGGTVGFVIGNAVLIAPVVIAASAEIGTRLPQKTPKPRPQAPQPTQRPQQSQPQRQDIPRPNVAEGFVVPTVPIWDPVKQQYVS